MKNEMDIKGAVEEVLSGQSQGSVAKKYGMALSTLHRAVNKERHGLECMPEGGGMDITETVLDGLQEDSFGDNEDFLSQDVDSSSLPLKKATSEVQEVPAPEYVAEAGDVGQATNGNEENAVLTIGRDAGKELTMVASPALDCQACEQIQKLNLEISCLKDTAEQVPALLEKLQTVESSAEAVEMMQQRLEELNIEKARLETEVNEVPELNNRVRVAEADVSSLREEMQALQASNHQVLSEKAILEQDVDAKESLIESAKKSLEEKLNEIISVQKDKEAMEKQWLAVSAESKDLGQKLSGTQKALEDMQNQRLQEFKRANENEALKTNLEREIVALKESIEMEKKTVEDDCMKTAQKAVNAAGTAKIFMWVVIVLGMPGVSFVTYKVLQVMGRLV